MSENRRSRSRTRSWQNSEFRIRDEENTTTKNIVSGNKPVTRPHRSLSRLTKTNDPNLLQTALQNRNRYSSPEIPSEVKQKADGMRTLSEQRDHRFIDPRFNDPRINDSRSKHIRMISNERGPTSGKESRPAMKRWNSIQYLSQDNKATTSNSSSISPLTVIKDQYDTKRPVSNYSTSTAETIPVVDNSFRTLETVSKDESFDQDETGPLSNRLYNRMSKFLTSRGKPKPEGTVDSTPTSTGEVSVLKYHSELDNDSESEDGDSTDPQNYDSWTSPNVNINDTSNDVNIDSVLTEINDFQNNFVQKYNTSTPQGQSIQDSSTQGRIQRKILEYKDLYSQDDDLKLSSNHHKNQGLISIYNDHNFKIQYETILQQYNFIRFRYSSGIDPDHYTFAGNLIDTQDQLRSNVGISGFLNRSKICSNKNGTKDPSNETNSPLNLEGVHESLTSTWNQEMARLCI